MCTPRDLHTENSKNSSVLGLKIIIIKAAASQVFLSHFSFPTICDPIFWKFSFKWRFLNFQITFWTFLSRVYTFNSISFTFLRGFHKFFPKMVKIISFVRTFSSHKCIYRRLKLNWENSAKNIIFTSCVETVEYCMQHCKFSKPHFALVDEQRSGHSLNNTGVRAATLSAI